MLRSWKEVCEERRHLSTHSFFLAYTRGFKGVCGSLRKKCIHGTLSKKKTNIGEKPSFNEQLPS